MKLRIHGSSLRIRLTQPEVAQLAVGQVVEQSTPLSPVMRLTSSVRPSHTARTVQVAFEQNHLAVLLPMTQAQSWATSDDVGIEHFADFGGAEQLRVLVEKDFQCLHSEEELDADAFPNPHAAVI